MTLQIEPSPVSPPRERPSRPRAASPLEAPTTETTGAPAMHTISLEHGLDGRLWARSAARAAPVRVVRTFPWSAPDRHLSLRTSDDEELAFVDDPATLDAASRSALERALGEAGFVFVVERILELEEDFELRCWKVETPQGPRRFQTALDSWPRETPGGGLLVEDVSGDLFLIPKPDALDQKSQDLLWALVD